MIEICRDLKSVMPLFEGWEETMIWSCLQGVMGEVFVRGAEDEKAADRGGLPENRRTFGKRSLPGEGRAPENGSQPEPGSALEMPESAAAVLGDFTFLAGKECRELISYWPDVCGKNFRIMVPQSEAWAGEIEAVYGAQAKKVTRYAIKKEPDVFDRGRLKEIADSLEKEYILREIDEELYKKCLKETWSRDLVAQFKTYEEYRRLGVGVVALKDGEIVSGASSYTAYRGGIEVEIDTKKEYRRRGLASACGAELILSCMERGLYPSWDAQNLWSVALAEKLGYHFDREYTAYEVVR